MPFPNNAVSGSISPALLTWDPICAKRLDRKKPLWLLLPALRRGIPQGFPGAFSNIRNMLYSVRLRRCVVLQNPVLHLLLDAVHEELHDAQAFLANLLVLKIVENLQLFPDQRSYCSITGSRETIEELGVRGERNSHVISFFHRFLL